jgi:hypothetical protein
VALRGQGTFPGPLEALIRTVLTDATARCAHGEDTVAETVRGVSGETDLPLEQGCPRWREQPSTWTGVPP